MSRTRYTLLQLLILALYVSAELHEMLWSQLGLVVMSYFLLGYVVNQNPRWLRKINRERNKYD